MSFHHNHNEMGGGHLGPYAYNMDMEMAQPDRSQGFHQPYASNFHQPHQPQQQMDPNAFATMHYMAAMQHMQSPVVPNPPPVPPPAPTVYQPPPLPSFDPRPDFDEPLLNVIRRSANEHNQPIRSYKDALETLHGHFNLPAHYWKDYYLQNAFRLEAILRSERERTTLNGHANVVSPAAVVHESPAPSITPSNREESQEKQEKQMKEERDVKLDVQTKSTTSTGKTRGRPKKAQSTSQRSPSPAPVRRKQKTPSAPNVPLLTKSRRQTINSIVSEPIRKYPDTVLVDEKTDLPRVPSRSPSPPPCPPDPRQSGSKKIPFSEAEKAFFWKFIVYECHKDPDVEKAWLSQTLAEKVPTHSAGSWSSFWKNNEREADAIYYYYGLTKEEKEEFVRRRKAASGDGSPQKPRGAKPVAKYTDLSDTEIEKAVIEENNVEDSDEDAEGSDASDAESDPADYNTEDDRAFYQSMLSAQAQPDFGEKGDGFSDYEYRILAQHIANQVHSSDVTFENWTTKENWDIFYDSIKSESSRTYKAWKEFYRRDRLKIDKMARRIYRATPLPAGGKRRGEAEPERKPTFSELVKGPTQTRKRSSSEVEEGGKRARSNV